MLALRAGFRTQPVFAVETLPRPRAASALFAIVAHMVGFHILNPLLYVYTKVAPQLINVLYRRFGVTGILSMPFITLTVEKVFYDSLQAARGYDLQEERRKSGQNPHGDFPSGGAALPSWSLVPVASEEDRLIIGFLGDRPRWTPAAESQSSGNAE
jgi:hypothetical protein